ncbi:uncharacterized protein BCR38DRAFT_456931 [Pseudomassariella vexata]|uniref:Uncharacterized protein n=1 Tax=Pseudomassariella vexata TaxID=1141098 RepID=A0A1Y2E4K1_9PEZI|nr:uncharacterized protein BCR38DRAFT_456931 [Pseudomassariella vexata]ORY66367.1 hypothetical protein BCR38DRAFT_456931 [Pseudomassariella vexata]
MGNICGKQESENFSTPGRVVGAAPPQPQRASVPAKVGGPPRTLGGKDTSASQGSSGGATADDARQRAAEAAEARAKAASKATGKLGFQLQAQRKQTRQDILKEVSQQEVRARDADEAAQARNYN